MSGPHYRMARAPFPDLDEHVEVLVHVLREQGPLNLRALRTHAHTRYWGPGCLGAALRRAREQGRVRRAGFRTYAAT